MKRLKNGLKMKLKVFSQKFVGMVGFPAISPNGIGLSEVAEHKTPLELQMFKLR